MNAQQITNKFSKMGILAVAGCSFAAGTGFFDEKDSPELWVNLCHRNINCFNELQLVNLSKGGASNAEVFEQAVEAISLYPNLKYLICSWTSMPRYSFNVGFELYDTNAGNPPREHKLNDRVIPADYIANVRDRLRSLIHLQYEIVKLIKYINIIKQLAPNVKIINVNSLCPWDNQFFTQLTDNFLPSDMTEFTRKEILNTKTRDDEEIYKLYALQHKQYTQVGGITASSWVNLYNSFLTLQTDVNLDNHHPGINSNKLYYNLVKIYTETNY